MKKRLFIFMLVIIFLFCGCSKSEIKTESLIDEIVILFTANVNCEGDNGITYAGVSACKKEMQNLYEYVSLVDAGNYLSGKLLGTLSNGSYATEIMNSAEYDVAAVGKKDLYYDIEKIEGLQSSMNFDIVSCNLIDKDSGESVFSPYQIETYGNTKVAFVGITTPSAYNCRTSKKYVDDNGNIKYEFCQDENGKKLYDKVQGTVDSAKAAGADYVIALSNLGENDLEDKWDVRQLIVHTSGIDAVIDGGSDNVIEKEMLKNKSGMEVLLTEPGRGLAQIGKIRITDKGITSELLSEYRKKDVKTNDFMAKVIQKYKKSAQDAIVYIRFPLVMKSEDGKNYYIRHQETNLGDLCADAYREGMGADIALVDAGSIGEGVVDRDITYTDVAAIFPYNQQACLIKAKGKTILDALELATSQCPYSNRSFLQVSGIKFEVNTSLPPAVINEDSDLAYISDEYRVHNVQVMNRDSGEYEPLEMDKEYKVAMSNYMYKGLSGTFLMFQGCEYILDEELSDSVLLMQYLMPYWETELPRQYDNKDGDGRITIAAK